MSDTGAAPAVHGKAAAKPWGWLRYAFAAVLLVAAGLYGAHWWQIQQTYQITDDAQLVSDLLPVTSEIAGRAIKVPVKENDAVKAGDLLVQLDPAPFQIALDEAQANLLVAQQRAATAKASIALAESQARALSTQAKGGVSESLAGEGSADAQVAEAQEAVKADEAKVDDAQAQRDLAKAQYDRFNELAGKGYVTQLELDKVNADLQSAEANLRAAQKDLSEARAHVDENKAEAAKARATTVSSRGQIETAHAAQMQTKVNQAEYETALAQVKVSAAAVAEAQLNLSRTRLVALADGTVGRKLVAPGQQIAPGQNLLALVLPTMWVVANFKETQVRRMHPGQSVEIEVDALPGKPLNGTIESFSPASGAVFSLLPPENASGNFTKVVQRIPVKIRLDEVELKAQLAALTPGMSVVARVKVR